MLRHWGSLALLLPLSTVSRTSDERTQPPASSAGKAETPPERAAPALFTWADVEGDGRLELAAVSAGRLRLLTDAGDGRFADATAGFGLAAVENAALALWGDYDADGKLDLFVGARAGASRLFHNEGGVFVDMTAASGLASDGAVQSAQWFDPDGDGRLDLFLVTTEKSELFRGLEGGFFERAELPLEGLAEAGSPSTGVAVLAPPRPGIGGEGRPEEPARPQRGTSPGSAVAGRGPASVRAVVSGSMPGPASTSPLVVTTGCANSVRDQASPATCLQASTSPVLGKLYPLSANLFVAVSGDVGLGTTSPSARLHVAGTARITDTLTLAPSGDQALDVSTGSIYKGGALFLHTKGGSRNTALGMSALSAPTSCTDNTAVGDGALGSTTTGGANTANGVNALFHNTTGSLNTATGAQALFGNTTGQSNTATGYGALYSNANGHFNTADGDQALSHNTTGGGNTACGASALTFNTTGGNNTAVGLLALFYNFTGNHNTALGQSALSSNYSGSNNLASGYAALSSNVVGNLNTACGDSALRNTTGSRNIGLGRSAGSNLTSGNDNIAIGNAGVAGEGATLRVGTAGTQTRAFIAGIRGVTTANANAIPVLVDSAGQLGTISSSRRFKEEIQDMGDRTDRLLALRPVVFRYKPEVQSGERPLEYGLIAEEVAEVFPELVVHDEEGQPFTVKYHLLSTMLLNELQKQRSALDEQQEELTRLRGLESRLLALEARVDAAAPPRDSR